MIYHTEIINKVVKSSDMKKGGRTKGTPNVLTSTVRERIKLILDNCLDNLNLTTLTNRERVELISKLLPYVTPRYTTIIESTRSRAESIKPTIINL